jgi:hypothetical protein
MEYRCNRSARKGESLMATVTVEEMVAAIEYFLLANSGAPIREDFRLAAAHDYILTAKSQIAEHHTQLQAANARASELFDELGIVQNEAATQRGELERQIAEMRNVLEAISDEDWQAIVNACEECGNAAQIQQDPEMRCERHDFLFDTYVRCRGCHVIIRPNVRTEESAHNDALIALNRRAAIPPASPELEAAYRAFGEWLDTMEMTAKAARLSSDSYASAMFTDKLMQQRLAEATSQYRLALNTAASKEADRAE